MKGGRGEGQERKKGRKREGGKKEREKLSKEITQEYFPELRA